MNPTLRLIAERYSCRHYTDQAVPDYTLEAIAQAAVQAPSAHNGQPWRVVVITDQELIGAIEAEALVQLEAHDPAYVARRRDKNGGQIFFRAPALVVIAADQAPSHYTQVDVGIAAENVVLAAASLGVASCVCGLAGAAFRGQGAEGLRQRLGFPPGFDFGISIILGYSAKARPPHEPDRSKISYRR